MRIRLLNALGPLLTLCMAVTTNPIAAPAQEPSHVCFLTVAKLGDSGHSERRNYVINDRAAWEDLWAKVGSHVSPNLPRPEVDFTRRTVIAVFQGSVPTSGFEVLISDIIKTEDGIKVVVKETVNSHCGGTGSVIRPFHIVEIDKQEQDQAEAEFKFKQKEKRCP